MYIIGLTGGMGSGKSTVSKILAELGAKIIDADKIARDVTGREQPAFQRIVNTFGREFIGQDGELDRKSLAELVFSSPEKLNALNEITHPQICMEIIRRMDQMKADPEVQMVVIDAAIPFEKGFLDTADEVWVVVTDREQRIRRVTDKGIFNRQECIQRMDAQMSDSEYLKMADTIIENNNTVEDLRRRVTKQFAHVKDSGKLYINSKTTSYIGRQKHE